MIEELTVTIPTVVDVTMYKYNHIDNKFMTLLRNQVDYRQMNDDSVLITRNQLKTFIDMNYQTELNKIRSTGSELFHTEVNSVFFLHQMAVDFTNLEYIKFSINKSKAYSRLVDLGDGSKIIKFNYRILTGTLRLHHVFTDKELKILNEVLVSMKLLKEGVPYATHETLYIFDTLDKWLAANIEADEKIVNVVQDLLDIIDPKIEMDNPKLLLITDY